MKGDDQTTMQNSSFKAQGSVILADNSIMQNSMVVDSSQKSPKQTNLPALSRGSGNRKVYMQKKGLVLNHRDLPLNGVSGDYSTQNPSRNPFLALQTERPKENSALGMSPQVVGVGMKMMGS
jgi:hypothetical protein